MSVMQKMGSIILLLFLGGCCGVKVDREFHHVSNKIKQSVQGDITYKSSDYISHVSENADLDGLSLHDAVAYALKNNRALQAKYEEIGIAKADVEQAGLLSNPELATAIRYPDRGSHVEDSNVELEASIKISDFWQVPFKKQVSDEVLEQVMLSVQSMVLDTILETKMAYINCLYAERKLENTQHTREQSVALRDTVYTRYEHGYANDLDRYLIDAFADQSYLDVLDQEAEVKKAYVRLQKVLGMSISGDSFALTTSFSPEVEALPELLDLKHQAMRYRPEAEFAHRRVAQYEALVRFERSRIVEDVNFGVAYERELDGVRLRGPSLSLNVPIFDPNYAQIARAEFLYAQAKKHEYDVQTTIEQEVYEPYIHLQSLYQEYEHIQGSLLPAIENGIDFAQYYKQQKRLTMPELINTLLFFYENQQRNIEIEKMVWQNKAQLERAVGATVWSL